MYRQLFLERSDGRIMRASLRGALRVLNVLLHEFYGASDRDHGPTKLVRPCSKGSEFIGSRRPLCADRPSSTSSAAGAGLGTRRHRARHCSGACWMRRRHASSQHVSRIYSLRTTDMTSLSHASVHEHEGGKHKVFFSPCEWPCRTAPGPEAASPPNVPSLTSKGGRSDRGGGLPNKRPANPWG